MSDGPSQAVVWSRRIGMEFCVCGRSARKAGDMVVVGVGLVGTATLGSLVLGWVGSIGEPPASPPSLIAFTPESSPTQAPSLCSGVVM
jgi:hypothetical protein